MKILTIIGTRPEVIRLSRVMARLDQLFDHLIVHTGQNYDYELNEVFFSELGIRRPNYFLESAMSTTAETIAKCIEGLDKVLAVEKPHAVLILGDTNSGLSVIAAKKRHIPIFHMEAGNRCFDLRVPEEVNRKILDHTSDINLVYTEHARRNLLNEGLPPDQIFLTGSPMAEVLNHYALKIDQSSVTTGLGLTKESYFVASFHREENVDDPHRLKRIVDSLNSVADTFRYPIILSTHPRTRLRLKNIQIHFHPLIHDMKPFGFFDYVRLQRDAFCTISDSGTITEEAAICGFPAITARDAHERPEGTDCGVLVLSDISAGTMVRGIRMARAQFENDQRPAIPESYQITDVSWRVAKLIEGYTSYVNRKTWHKKTEDEDPLRS